MWLYKEKVINGIEDMPKNSFGFIYEVCYTPTNEKYLGKKVLQFNKKLPPLKGFKRKRKVIVESDWKTYYGSHQKIKTLLKENKQDNFKRNILEFSFNKKHLTYLETKYLFCNHVLENTEYINDNILGKFFRKDLVNPNS
tara:strand:- start:48 stop:467 length:420 start_codon:yes stop_codon:yes gene_type:complete